MSHLLVGIFGAFLGTAMGYGMATYAMLARGLKPPLRAEWMAPNLVPLTPDDELSVAEVRRRLGMVTTTTQGSAPTVSETTRPWSGPPYEVLN